MNFPPRLLSAKEAAFYLGISVTGLHRHVSAGVIPAPKCIGGRALWDRVDLDAYVDTLAQGETAQKTGWEDVEAARANTL